MSSTPGAVGLSAERLARLDALFNGYIERDEIAGAIARVSRRGQVAYARTMGWLDREARIPMRDDAIFQIMSMTKPVTAVALMTLYDEGAFHLNTPIASFLPEFRDTKVFARETADGIEVEDLKQPLTFRHLFTHTAGLSYGWNDQDPVDRAYQAETRRKEETGEAFTNQTLCEGLARLPLAFQPGTHWRYSLAIDVLGRLIEVISGKPLDVFFEDRIFKPLDMVDTGFFVPPSKMDRVATVYGHPEPGKGLLRMDKLKPHQSSPSWLSGGGGLVSTMDDYARFAQMLVNGGALDGTRILSPRTVALFSQNHAPAAALPYGFVDNDLYHAGYGYSLGTRVLMDVSASGLSGSVGEFGWDGAFATYFWVDPTESLTGVLMLQHTPNAQYPLHQQFKQLTYQALEA